MTGYDSPVLCKGCGQQIIWATTVGKKRPIPLDHPQVSDVKELEDHRGLFVFVDLNMTRVRTATPMDVAWGDAPLFRTHFVTCPKAALFKGEPE